MPVSNAAQSSPKKDVKDSVNPQVSFLGTQPFSAEAVEKMSQEMLDRVGKEKLEGGPTVKEIISQIVKESGTLAQQLKIDAGKLEAIYNIGYQCHNQGNYKKSIGVFRLLFLLNPLETKYLFSLGLSLEKDKQFYAASTAYMLNTLLDESNPVPTFRTGICFLELKKSVVAEIMFEKAISQCKGKPGMEAVSQRAKLFLSGLKKPAEQ